MSAFVLVLVLKVGFGQAGVVIDMPDGATCKAAGRMVARNEAVNTWFCIGRDALTKKDFE